MMAGQCAGTGPCKLVSVTACCIDRCGVSYTHTESSPKLQQQAYDSSVPLVSHTHVLFRARVDEPGNPHTNTLNHAQMHSPCSDAFFGRATTARVSLPRNWDVSIRSHMQQDMGFSFGTSTSERIVLDFFATIVL